MRLVYQNNLTIWAHRWVGIATDIHDHTESKSGVYILRGELVEEFYRPPNPTPTTRVLKQGRYVGQGGRPFTHRLLGDNNTISLHAYSPRIDDVMTIFEFDQPTGELQPTRDSTGASRKK